MGRSIRLVVVALVTALTVAACGGAGKEEAAPTAAAPSASTPQVVDDGTLAAGEKISAPKGEVVLTGRRVLPGDGPAGRVPLRGRLAPARRGAERQEADACRWLLG